jgi:hypothetical protein
VRPGLLQALPLCRGQVSYVADQKGLQVALVGSIHLSAFQLWDGMFAPIILNFDHFCQVVFAVQSSIFS